jgi:flavin-dependent dehydrogenase
MGNPVSGQVNDLPYDVAIAGGGPSGSLLAQLLARSGRRVLLLEASALDKRKICGEYLCPKGVELLREAGLASLLVGSVVRGMRLFSPKGIAVESRFPGGCTGLALRRDRFDPALLLEATKAGAELRRGNRLEAFHYSGGIWELRAGAETFRSRLLVGADGRHSFVARELGVQEALPKNRRRVALHFFARSERAAPELGEMHILRDGSYAGISPTGPNELNVSLVCDAEKAKPGGLAAAEALLELSPYLAGRFLPLLPQTQVTVAYPVSHQVHSIAGPSWALVGDAAGFLDPLTGEGIFQALKSASLLAARVLEAFDGASLTSSLAAYRNDHESAFGGKGAVNRFFQSLIRYPAACDWVGNRLRSSPARADAFIGIVGNVHSPATGIKQILLSPFVSKSVQ